ncbi:mycofactocin-associated electron transfer flavoprotein alpha subunit [Kitasatospora sp. P5_F3]
MNGTEVKGTEPIAVLLVRGGELPPGADETVAEAGGLALLAGEDTKAAAGLLTTATRVWTVETGTRPPGLLATALAPLLTDRPIVLLPASPDGRDLAPRLAVTLDRPLLASALAVHSGGADLIGADGRTLVDAAVLGPFVATLEPGLRGAQPLPEAPEIIELPAPDGPVSPDAEQCALLTAPPGQEQLDQATRIVAAGAGLGTGELTGPAAIALLEKVGASLGAAVGATRVVTDAGWTGEERQIGTTGVVVAPELYLAFGISGAAQHVGGLGHPAHLVSVNTDPHCPMTALADLAVVADAPTVLAELASRLTSEAPRD